ncbi:DHA2 family efflux MFS transporter permease subunit [Asticcacaulis sp. 201]|uniref:DHA2 family efflux MFS transporter permease subunit n=1 Tax=Asticcacaulis sp. 201 TaxID=3028787 RepID=UPI002916531A|nr:DHA2 family efflux MFS transporter permease subunit [Asticcacaulis sp. 201]MDV6331738.1 DHA2 family efflux MFS transporter permease subunit [Asticcacaulis sp. 201]
MSSALPSPAPDMAQRLLPWLVAVAFFMEALDTTILNTGVPVIAKSLDVTPLSMKAVLSSYTLSLAVFIPISGWMADRFGTRRVFAAAIGLFTLGSLLCGLSTNIHVLVACRVLQGMGGAMMTPVGRLVMVQTFSRADLVRAMSFVAVPALIAPMLGPLIGGLIVDYLHWRVIFFVNIPVGILGAALVWLNMPDYRGTTPRPLDVLGLILFSSGVALLSYVLEVFGEHRLGLGGIFGLLAISFLLLFGYGMHATKTAFPLLNMTLFRIRTFATSVSGSFITRLGIGGAPFLLPMLYQVGLGLTPVQSGLLIMPQAIASMSTKFLLPRVLQRFGYRNVLVFNTLALGLMLMMFGTIGRGTPIWVIVAQAMVYGGLTSLQFTSMNTLVYADVPRDQSSGASTIASTLQQLSVSFGVAAAGLTTIFFLPTEATANPSLMLDGLHKAFFVLGGFTLVSTLVFSRLKREDGGEEAGEKDLHLDEAKG